MTLLSLINDIVVILVTARWMQRTGWWCCHDCNNTTCIYWRVESTERMQTCTKGDHTVHRTTMLIASRKFATHSHNALGAGSWLHVIISIGYMMYVLVTPYFAMFKFKNSSWIHIQIQITLRPYKSFMKIHT